MAADATADAETNWKHKVTPDWGDLMSIQFGKFTARVNEREQDYRHAIWAASMNGLPCGWAASHPQGHGPARQGLLVWLMCRVWLAVQMHKLVRKSWLTGTSVDGMKWAVYNVDEQASHPLGHGPGRERSTHQAKVCRIVAVSWQFPGSVGNSECSRNQAVHCADEQASRLLGHGPVKGRATHLARGTWGVSGRAGHDE